MKLPPLHLPGVPYKPTLMQWIALSLPHTRELLYGGSAGGGKSDFLLMAALQYIDIPTYSAVIFRRTFPQLAAAEDGLMARAQSWLGPHPDFEGRDPVSGVPTRWKYRNGGSLTFSHLQYDKDKYGHQGPSYQFIGWDELTQFLEGQYLYLLSRLRRLEGFPAPLRVRGASNPGGIGHDWVRDRFPIPRDGTSHPIEGRGFVPAKLADNPHLDGELYAETLAELHPFERDQLLNGDWDARPPGARFKREWFQIVERAPDPASGRWVRAWDLAATEPKAGSDPDWTVGVLLHEQDQHYTVADVERFRGSPAAVDARLRATAEMDGHHVKVWIEQEGGSSGKIAASHLGKVLDGFDVSFQPSTGDKVVRSNPYASAAERGDVSLVQGPWLRDYVTELEMFPGGSHDDQVDGSSLGYSKLALRRGITAEDLWGGANAAA